MQKFIFGSLVWSLTLGTTLASDWVSYRENAISNSESIRQFDVLMKVTAFDTGAKKQVKRSIRIALDFDRKLCFCLDVMESEDPTDSKKSAKTLVRVAIQNDKIGRIKRYPGQGYVATTDLQSTLNEIGVPDPRCVGLGSFPQPFSQKGMETGFESYVTHRARTTDRKGAPREEKITHARDYTRIWFPSTTARAEYDFEPKTSMPLRYVQLILNGNSFVRLQEEDYTWKDVEGVFVPKSVLSSRVLERSKLGVVIGEELITGNMHWFTVNEPISKSLLDLNLVDDLSKLVKLVDPVPTGADTLRE